MATSVKMQCDACSKECPDLRRCTGCFEVSYCSRGCQTGHWKIHKKRCKPESKKTNGDHPPPKSSGNADNTEVKKSSDKKGSPRANKASSPPSSARDARASPPSNNGDSGVGGSDPGKVCALCGSNKDVKSCSACGKIAYCSKTCQKADWKCHKQECVQTEGHKTSDFQGRRREAAKAAKAAKDDRPTINIPYKHPINVMTMPTHAELEHEEERPRGSLARALRVARERFPFKIIDKFAAMSEMFSGYQCVLVAFMFKYHGYFMRHGICIKDKYDNETHVLFYIDYGSPLPYFRWEDVRPGRYICITNPGVHHFMDGSVGMRIDEPDEVAFIDV